MTLGDGPNREELLQMAVRAAKQGQRDGARMMLRKILMEDKRNERALMWMAKISRNNKERRQWLDRILMMNPDNQSAISALEHLEYEEQADRNRTLMRVGIGAWVAFVLIGSVVLFIIMIS